MAVTQVDVGGSIVKGLQINQMRQQIEAHKQAQEQASELRSLATLKYGGYDPKSGITWDTGRQHTRTTAGRPVYTDAETGERYSEKSMTAPHPAMPGKWLNFPTVDDRGRVLSEGDALSMAQQAGFRDPITGRPLSTFDSMEEATEAARARSAGLRAVTEPSVSDDEFVGRAMAISPQAGMDWFKFFQSQDAATLERQKAEAPIWAALLSGVQDQQGYDRVRQTAHARGLDTSDMPPEFNQGNVNYMLQAAKVLADIKPQSVAPGNTLVDPITGQPVFTAPNKPPTPTNLSKLIAERDALPPNDPRRAQYDAAITKASTHKPGDRISFGGENELFKTIGKGAGERYNMIQDQAFEAMNQRATYEAIDSVLEGVETGAMKQTTTDIKAIAKSIGIDLEAFGITDDVSNVQAANAFSNQLALRFRNPDSGFGLTGNTSDRDVKFLQSITPQVWQTPEGRQMISEVMRRIANRKIDTAMMASDYLQENGRFDAGFTRELERYADANPLFDDLDVNAVLSKAKDDAPYEGRIGILPDGSRVIYKGGRYLPLDQGGL